MTSDLVRRLRRNATEAGKALWRLLRDRSLGSVKFRRQCPIGRFVADFAYLRLKLIIEADGGQHASSETDTARTARLKSQGFRVLRFRNRDILENPEGVAATILEALGGTRPTPPRPAAHAVTLSRKGRGAT